MLIYRIIIYISKIQIFLNRNTRNVFKKRPYRLIQHFTARSKKQKTRRIREREKTATCKKRLDGFDDEGDDDVTFDHDDVKLNNVLKTNWTVCKNLKKLFLQLVA